MHNKYKKSHTKKIKGGVSPENDISNIESIPHDDSDVHNINMADDEMRLSDLDVSSTEYSPLNMSTNSAQNTSLMNKSDDSIVTVSRPIDMLDDDYIPMRFPRRNSNSLHLSDLEISNNNSIDLNTTNDSNLSGNTTSSDVSIGGKGKHRTHKHKKHRGKHKTYKHHYAHIKTHKKHHSKYQGHKKTHKHK